METQGIKLDRQEARSLYRKYKEHVHYSTPIDYEIMRTYQLIAQGRVVIKAIESVKAAGFGPDGLPKLALCRADKVACHFEIEHNGSAVMRAEGANVGWRGIITNSAIIRFPADSFPRSNSYRPSGRAILPSIPLHLRPKRGLANYHILWEAEWTKVPPRDPYLLRRIGKADLWLVVAAWDLTEVERAALATRMNG